MEQNIVGKRSRRKKVIPILQFNSFGLSRSRFQLDTGGYEPETYQIRRCVPSKLTFVHTVNGRSQFYELAYFGFDGNEIGWTLDNVQISRRRESLNLFVLTRGTLKRNPFRFEIRPIHNRTL